MEHAASDSDEPVRFDTRVVILLAPDLLPWQELNITAFLAGAIATSAPGLVGEPYRDADGNEYLPMLRQPTMILTADAALLASARARALAREMSVAVYTRGLFETPHDGANRAEVARWRANELDLVGVGTRGPRNAVDRLVKGARKHD